MRAPPAEIRSDEDGCDERDPTPGARRRGTRVCAAHGRRGAHRYGARRPRSPFDRQVRDARGEGAAADTHDREWDAEIDERHLTGGEQAELGDAVEWHATREAHRAGAREEARRILHGQLQA